MRRIQCPREGEMAEEERVKKGASHAKVDEQVHREQMAEEGLSQL